MGLLGIPLLQGVLGCIYSTSTMILSPPLGNKSSRLTPIVNKPPAETNATGLVSDMAQLDKALDGILSVGLVLR